MQTTCPNCQAKGNIRDEWNGKKAKCPTCNEIFTVQADRSAEPSIVDAPPDLDLAPDSPPQQEAASEEAVMADCSECAKPFPESELINFESTLVCANCKHLYLQKIREGVSGAGRGFQYAGFWIRLVAKMVDGIITGLASGAITMGGAFLLMSGDPSGETMATILLQVSSFAVAIAYATWFVGKFGATPGKMAVGLKIIKPDGTGLTYMQAFGRYWAELLSGITMGIGYLMVAFDRQEHRALHDRICQSRVIKSK